MNLPPERTIQLSGIGDCKVLPICLQILSLAIIQNRTLSFIPPVKKTTFSIRKLKKKIASRFHPRKKFFMKKNILAGLSASRRMK